MIFFFKLNLNENFIKIGFDENEDENDLPFKQDWILQAFTLHGSLGFDINLF